MAKLAYDLVSPERKLASGEADAIQIPGAEGDLTAMPEHAPFLTPLRPGVVTVRDGGSETAYVVTGGFAEISPAGAAVLAEEAVKKDEVSAEWFAAKIAEAEKAHEIASGQGKTIAALRLNDMKFLASTLGF
ncbi:ATP synthase F1 subunit epsilon [Albimonas sp. CAU 1670]|uniref:ATP synthase F1 subunit epsilon n=1 Tax=Albimonas sp. CAU 1670 TaxID=3032599 RepID=UPI0023DC3DEB|nr:ATP synthase F1 subunit epsilon [Albimonas sp. CAU 1670]MDF2231091.1 ATP synthase F1 subunit epsilon [Albimonas sp. CAU 1670]